MNYIIPSWRDLDIELGRNSQTYLDYQVIGRDLEYEGRAYANNEGKVIVRVSDLIRDTLQPQMPIDLQDGIEVMNMTYNTVEVFVNNNVVHTVTMILDNSYVDNLYEETAKILSQPITGLLDPRQKLIFNVGYYDDEDLSINGQIFSFENDFSYNVMFNQTMPTGNTVTIEVGDDEKVFTIKPSSADYCLYYVNELGGFDSILLNNKVTKKTVNTPTTYKKYGNNTLPKHQNLKLNNNSQITMEFVTGWLKDNQTKHIHNIFNTTCAYLHNLNTDEIIPVNISTNQYNQMTMRSNGKKYVNYTIQCEYSITRKII